MRVWPSNLGVESIRAESDSRGIRNDCRQRIPAGGVFVLCLFSRKRGWQTP